MSVDQIFRSLNSPKNARSLTPLKETTLELLDEEIYLFVETDQLYRNEEIYLFVETDQLYRNYGSVVVATVATACSGS